MPLLDQESFTLWDLSIVWEEDDGRFRVGLHGKNLSRALEDGGTITSPLIPWNSCGHFMATTLLVSTGSYFMYAFLNLVNPLISMLYGFTGWTIEKVDPHEVDAEEAMPFHPPPR